MQKASKETRGSKRNRVTDPINPRAYPIDLTPITDSRKDGRLYKITNNKGVERTTIKNNVVPSFSNGPEISLNNNLLYGIWSTYRTRRTPDIKNIVHTTAHKREEVQPSIDGRSSTKLKPEKTIEKIILIAIQKIVYHLLAILLI